MFNQNFFIRLLIAGVGAYLLLLAIPAFLQVIGLGTTEALMVLIKVVVAACALYYLFFGTGPTQIK